MIQLESDSFDIEKANFLATTEDVWA